MTAPAEIKCLKSARWTACAGIFVFGAMAGLGVPEHTTTLMGIVSFTCWGIFSRLGRAIKDREAPLISTVTESKL